jgi:hypothetical protein
VYMLMSSCHKEGIRHVEDRTSIVLGAVRPRGETVACDAWVFLLSAVESREYASLGDWTGLVWLRIGTSGERL